MAVQKLSQAGHRLPRCLVQATIYQVAKFLQPLSTQVEGCMVEDPKVVYETTASNYDKT